jgi:hypothetical protein
MFGLRADMSGSGLDMSGQTSLRAAEKYIRSQDS